MAEGGEDDDKKHDPSEKKLRDAGERGELPRSPELSGVGTTVALAAALTIGGGSVATPVMAYLRTVWATDGPLDLAAAHGLLVGALTTIATASLRPLAAGAAVALALGLAQTRFQVAPKAFEARLERMNPMSTFQQLYMSRQPLVELAKGLLHVGALGAVTAYTIWGHAPDLPRLAGVSPRAMPPLLADLGWDVVVRALPVMVLLAALDYGWSTYRWWTGLMRTDQEVRDEHKESEGDPMMRAQRKRRMRELATRNAIALIKEADVVVTNPTHYAVALRYRPGKDAAPVVLVKGVDHLALRLRAEAYRLDVPRVEDRALARALYAQVPQGRAVPAALYGPVARVLAVVYRRRRRRA
ncbi:MAG: EscU/YscU/HrcU family type III secretion system export apparatus switch protein [Myxococcota bacterium]